jgi:hypothetical protein
MYYVNIHFSFTKISALTIKEGDGENVHTYVNSALKALLGIDIFPRVPK